MTAPAPTLSSALADLRARLAVVRLGLALPDADRSRAAAAELVGQLDDYVLPRLRQVDAPLLTVVGGSTGAGKSTLVNSLVGEDVTVPGVLRPTTRSPVLVCSPADRDWYAATESGVLPHLARTTGSAGAPGTLQLVVSSALPPGLAVLDAPDIDSVVTANRELATQLLAAADLWLFVTTAARYADAVPWDMLGRARQRSTALAVVINRIPPEAVSEVSAHLGEMLQTHGLGDARLFAVAEAPLDDGRLPEAAVAPVRDWLHSLAADAEARATVVRTTLHGALANLVREADAVAATLDDEQSVAAGLRSDADAAYAEAAESVDRALRQGSLLRGEVLARWQDFVGTGELMRSIEARIGRLRDRLRALVTGAPTAVQELHAAVETSVESLVRAAAGDAAEQTVDAWRQSPAGRALVGEAARELSRPTAGFDERCAEMVREWQAGVLALVTDQAAGKRGAARAASFGVNATGAAAMVAVFAHTGGLTGAEVAIAGGTTAVNQKLLEAVFGDQAVRTLAATARRDLLERVTALLADERQRFDDLLDAASDPANAADDLRAAGRATRELLP